jgi:hypothetical protein
MECPKCKTVNADTEHFCRRCHMTLLYKCPSCGATQRTGGKCDTCGIDFAKYMSMVVAQEQIRANREHERVREHVGIWKQIILLPVTGGFSLIKYFRNRSSA